MTRVLTIATLVAAVCCALVACSGVSRRAGAPPAKTAPASDSAPIPGAAAERLTDDTPRTTVEGNTFIAPRGWSISLRGSATVLEVPEGNSRIALVDVRAGSADAAVAAAWQTYMPDASWPLMVVHRWQDEDGWTDRHEYRYETSPGENRLVSVDALRAGEVWTVAIYDMDAAVADKRTAEVSLIYDDLLPKGYTRESFAGRPAHDLDPARIAALTEFVESAMRILRVSGVAIGLVQDGRVVFADGFGVREIGGTEKVDADTLFMIGSNGKALTTLMLAKLVDEGKLTWENLKGDMLIFCGNFVWAVYTVFSKPLLGRISPLKWSSLTLAVGTVFYLPFCFPAFISQDFAQVSFGSWSMLAFSGLFALAFGYVVWYSSVKRIGNSKTVIYGNIVPIFTVIFAAIFIAERIGIWQALGAVIILVGVYLTRSGYRIFPNSGKSG